MDQSNKAEKNLFRKDIILLAMFLSMTIAVFGFALLQIMPLTGTGTIGCIIMTIASVTVISIVWASTEVMTHLQRNQGRIYKEDLTYQRLILEQKKMRSYEK